MKELNLVLTELGISKVRLAKYLGVSRQMLYNYLGIDNINNWPKEKAAKLLSLLNIDSIEALSDLKITGEYIIEVEGRLNEDNYCCYENIKNKYEFDEKGNIIGYKVKL